MRVSQASPSPSRRPQLANGSSRYQQVQASVADNSRANSCATGVSNLICLDLRKGGSSSQGLKTFRFLVF